MEKLIYLLWKPQAQNIEAFRDQMVSQLAGQLTQAGAMQLRLAIADPDVEAAQKKRLLSAKLNPAPDALVSFWLNSAGLRQPAEKILADACTAISGYLVTESEPLPNTRHSTSMGQRTAGMNQVVLLRRPARLNAQEWLRLWLEQHTPIAIATQSTFGYRQNVVARVLTDNPLTQELAIDAIVEENFPPAALSSLHAFYNALDDQGKNDDTLLRKNQTAMFASVQRFIDLDKLDCLPMSEYNF
jgi:hypothetical protein